MSTKQYCCYVVRCKDKMKIGHTGSIEPRMKSIRTNSPGRVSLVATIPCASKYHALEIERGLHEKLKKHRGHGEWFTPKQVLRVLSKMQIPTEE